MEGKVILEEHFSTELNNKLWDAKVEETRNGQAYAQDIERRLIDPGTCVGCGTRKAFSAKRSSANRTSA